MLSISKPVLRLTTVICSSLASVTVAVGVLCPHSSPRLMTVFPMYVTFYTQTGAQSLDMTCVRRGTLR